MLVRVLGTAAGGGSPQWNCACEQCFHARDNRLHRTQDCVAISGDGSSWYLLNASPDLRAQLLAAPELVPGPGLRDTPLRGVLLTDAELDHVLGLFLLREAASLDVYATPAVLGALSTALPVRHIVDPYGQGWRWYCIDDSFDLDGGLRVTPFKLGEKRPRYVPDNPHGSGFFRRSRAFSAGEVGAERPTSPAAENWVIGYRIGDFVYAPCFGEWTDALDEALDRARVALIDGTFLSPDEMPNVKGHTSIADSLPHLSRHPGVRFLYTHLNNTNPLLSRRDPEIPLAAEMETPYETHSFRAGGATRGDVVGIARERGADPV